MTEVDSGESTDSSPKSLGSRLVHRLAELRHHKDLVVLAIGIVLSGVSTVIGVAHVNWPWLFGLGCGITAVAALATRALEARELKDRVRNLWAALAVSVVLLAGAFCYHEWWDPSGASPLDNQVMVNGTDVQTVQPYDQPNGSQTYEYPPIYSDMPISLVCYVSLPDGPWYRIYQSGGWIPRDAVHAFPGLAFPNLPHC
jgi:hypothetical protein